MSPEHGPDLSQIITKLEHLSVAHATGEFIPLEQASAQLQSASVQLYEISQRTQFKSLEEAQSDAAFQNARIGFREAQRIYTATWLSSQKIHLIDQLNAVVHEGEKNPDSGITEATAHAIDTILKSENNHGELFSNLIPVLTVLHPFADAGADSKLAQLYVNVKMLGENLGAGKVLDHTITLKKKGELAQAGITMIPLEDGQQITSVPRPGFQPDHTLTIGGVDYTLTEPAQLPEYETTPRKDQFPAESAITNASVTIPILQTGIAAASNGR